MRRDSSGKAVSYLEGKLGEMTDAYTLAITTYALELADSAKKNDAYNKLMALAKEDENGLHWGSDAIIRCLNRRQRRQPAMMRQF